ncbi:MAG: 6,7-dimethyl-8-ribityllumazine synthase [Deltaproteobacteria bacterium]|nr:6,7-dimethyl-8-ribityllumazine synthase [Deltaproteobacteria bacterium]
MMQTFEGKLKATGLKFAVVQARFNHFIADRLLEGALDALVRHGADEKDISIYKVPGSWEMPVLVSKLAANGDFDAIIAVGAVIRGATPHFEYVAAEAAKGLAQASIGSGRPVSFGLITADTIEQAIERAGTKSGNKGFDAALAAIEMANLFKRIG